MKQNIKNRLLRTAVFSVIALVIGSGVALWQIETQSGRVLRDGESRVTDVKPMAGLSLGGPFSLLDHNGQSVTEATYAGEYKLIYFGFTYCPAVCPTELQKMRAVMTGLPKEIAAKIQPIFVTIDPERDTVAVMKDYVSLFHPKLVGLTGTVPQVNMMKKNYRVFAVKAQDESAAEYTMDHSSFTYLMGPEDALIAMYRMKDDADYMAKDIAKKINPPE